MHDTLYDAIKDHLAKRKMAINELANRVGKTRSYFYQMLKHKINVPSREVIESIGKALSLDKNELLELKVLCLKQKTDDEDVKMVLLAGFLAVTPTFAKGSITMTLNQEEKNLLKGLLNKEKKRFENETEEGGEKSGID